MRIKQAIIILLECLKLLIFLLLLLAAELLRLLEDHVLILVSLGLYLRLLGSQRGFELLYLSLVVIDLSFLEDLSRLEQVFIVLMQPYGGFEFLVVLFDEFEELVLNAAFLLSREGRGDDCFEADSFTKEVLFLDVGLLKNADVR